MTTEEKDVLLSSLKQDADERLGEPLSWPEGWLEIEAIQHALARAIERERARYMDACPDARKRLLDCGLSEEVADLVIGQVVQRERERCAGRLSQLAQEYRDRCWTEAGDALNEAAAKIRGEE